MTGTMEAEAMDVAATITALRQQAVARGKAMGLSAADSTRDDPLRQAEGFAHVSAHVPLMWRIPLLGRGLSLVKRVARLLLRWYINPIVDQVNDFNAATVTALNTLAARQEALAARIAALEIASASASTDTATAVNSPLSTLDPQPSTSPPSDA